MDKRLVIAVVIDDVKQYFNLDIISNMTVRLNSTVSSYPLVEGDSISDHMYRQPASIDISGTFGRSGRFAQQNVSKNRLTDIQSKFERIKDERLFVDILSIYNVRQNYVLSDITWTEHASTIDYSFSFKQIYTAIITETVYEVDKHDELLPNLTDAVQLSLTETLIDWDQVHMIVLQAMQDAKLIDSKFLGEFGASIAVAGTGLGIAAAAVLFASNPVGWFVAGGVILAGGIYAAITAIEKAVVKNRYRTTAFKLYKDERKKKAEFTRFNNFLNEINVQLQVLEHAGSVYTMSANVEQECVINIDNNYYVFSFKQNNTSGMWSLLVKDISGKIINETASMVGIATLSEATSHNNLFVTTSGTYVYLINPQLLVAESVGIYDTKMMYGDLTNFSFFVTTVDMNEWYNLLADIVKNALLA